MQELIFGNTSRLKNVFVVSLMKASSSLIERFMNGERLNPCEKRDDIGKRWIVRMLGSCAIARRGSLYFKI